MASFMTFRPSTAAMCYRALDRAASPQCRQGLSMLNLLRKSAARKQDMRLLYDGLVSRAREPVFFAGLGVADSMDGRFDMLAFHAWLVLAELKGGQGAQGLIDTIFTGFDEAMREQGVGDIGIGHKLKAMAKAFYGRMAAYDGATSQEELAAALARNIWRGAQTDDRARKLAAYAFAAHTHLAASLPATLDFGPLPTI
jgi:cytochrome b pre-mRNA-processing protein 3